MPTKKEDLRKVKITKYDDGTGEHVTNAYFHTWASYPIYTDSGALQDSLAIVELEDGIVQNVRANRLKFVDTF